MTLHLSTVERAQTACAVQVRVQVRVQVEVEV